MVDITCPHCGFSKQIAAAKLPGRPARVTCPKCRQSFPLPVAIQGGAATPEVGGAAGAEKPSAPTPEPPAPPAPDPSAASPPESGAAPPPVTAPPATPGPPPTAPPAATEGTTSGEPPGETADPAPEEVTVTCPHCGYQRRVKREILPERPSRVSCRACRQLFPISRDLADPPHTPDVTPDQAPAPPSAVDTPATVEGPVAATDAGTPAGGRLPGVEELFGRSWRLFTTRIWTFLGILLLGGVLAIVPALLLGKVQDALAGFGSSWIVAGISATTALVFALLVFTWIGAAMFYAAVDEELGVRPCLGLALQRLWAWMWLFGLAGFVVAGGFLLFLIPGILFSVWFFFAYYVLAAEDVKGMEAMLKSREYVRGYAWPVFFRLLVLWLVTGFISAVLFFIPILGQLVSLLLAPFSLIYQGVLFQDLRQIKGDLRYDCSRRAKGKWLGIAAAGWVIPPVILFSLLLPHLGELQRLLPPAGSPVAGSVPLPGPDQARPPVEGLRGIEERPENLMVYVYAINQRGVVRVNGEEVYRIPGEENMNYNYTGGSDAFRFGGNRIEVDYQSLPDTSIEPQIEIRAYRYDWQAGSQEVLGEWRVGTGSGSQTFLLDIPVPSQLVGR